MTLQEFLKERGLSFEPVLDNKIHRCDRAGTKKDDDIWYIGSNVLLPSGKTRITLTVGDHTTGEKWYFPVKNGVAWSEEDRKYYESQAKKAQEIEERDTREKHESAAREAEKIWQSAGPASSEHPYVKRKKIGKDCIGLIKQSGGSLLIPVRGVDSGLRGLQLIDERGNKKFLYGTKKQGSYFRFPGNGSEGPIVICEGFATGASINEATGFETFISFDAGNLGVVCKYIRGIYPSHRIIIAGDDDRWKSSGKNVGREKATAAAKDVGGVAIFPKFVNTLRNETDFNDVHCLEGLESVRRQIELGIESLETGNGNGEGSLHHGGTNEESGSSNDCNSVSNQGEIRRACGKDSGESTGYIDDTKANEGGGELDAVKRQIYLQANETKKSFVGNNTRNEGRLTDEKGNDGRNGSSRGSNTTKTFRSENEEMEEGDGCAEHSDVRYGSAVHRYSESMDGELGESLNKKNEFPLDALGSMLESVVKVVAEKVSAPIEMVASSVLAGVCVAVQEHYSVSAFGSIRPISLFFVTIATSGDRKSTVDSIVLKPHNDWILNKFKTYEEEKSNYKSRLEEYKEAQFKKSDFKPTKPIAPKAPILFAKEPTIEGLFFCLKFHRNSIGLFTDEGGTWLGGYAMKSENIRGTLARLNSLWDGKPIDRVRRGGDDGEIDLLFNKRVSSHIMIQPYLADELFGNEYAKSQGYLARCLVCRPKSMIGRRKFLWKIDVKEEMSKYSSSITALLNKRSSEPVILLPGNGVAELVKKFYDELEPLQSEKAEYSFIGDFTSKLPEHCIRLAAMLEAFNNPGATEISEEWMSNAIKIGRFYLSSHVKTTNLASGAKTEDHDALYNFLMKNKGTTLKIRDIMRAGPRKFRKKDILVPAIRKMEEDGVITYDEKEKSITLNV